MTECDEQMYRTIVNRCELGLPLPQALRQLFWKTLEEPEIFETLCQTFNAPVATWILNSIDDLNYPEKVNRLLRRVAMDRVQTADTMHALDILISLGADIMTFPALMHICLTDKYNEHTVECAKMLIKAGVDPNLLNAYNTRILNIVVLTFSPSSVELTKLLIESGVDVNATSETTWHTSNSALTSVFTSIYGFNRHTLEIIQLLLGAGADANHKGRDNEKTALMSACIKTTAPQVMDGIIKELLRKSKVNQTDAQGRTALHHLMYSCRDATEHQVNRVRLLLDANADVEIKTRTGATALSILEYVSKKKQNKQVQEIMRLLKN